MTSPSPPGRRGEKLSLPSWICIARTQAVYYRTERGSEPVAEFIETLPKKHAVKIHTAIEEHLNDRASEAPPPLFPASSQIKGELRELRVRFANLRYRVIYQRSANLIVLLHAFEKTTGSVPPPEIETAERRLSDFRQRMNARRRVSPRAAGDDAP
jgi:phage-related protein